MQPNGTRSDWAGAWTWLLVMPVLSALAMSSSSCSSGWQRKTGYGLTAGGLLVAVCGVASTFYTCDSGDPDDPFTDVHCGRGDRGAGYAVGGVGLATAIVGLVLLAKYPSTGVSEQDEQAPAMADLPIEEIISSSAPIAD